jgi:DNA topoisomerase-2
MLDSRPGDLSNIPKLEDAKLAGTEHSKECTLILTEGDSAKSLVVSFLSLASHFNLVLIYVCIHYFLSK